MMSSKQEILQMDNDSSSIKGEIKEKQHELLILEESIASLKMLQKKALHIIECNKFKFQQYKQEMEAMETNFEKMTVKNDTQQRNTTDQLLLEIGELKNMRDLLQKQFYCQKKHYR